MTALSRPEPAPRSRPDSPADIVCLCHLKWEATLFQRPQQIMKRLARERRVLFVGRCDFRDWLRNRFRRPELFSGTAAGGKLRFVNLPYLPGSRRLPWLKDVAARISVRTARRLALRDGLHDVALWVCHPAFQPWLQVFPRSLLIYDRMDPYSEFATAPAADARRELDLLHDADLVFAGGRALRVGVEFLRPDALLLPSGVEFEHFAKAREAGLAVPSELAAIPGPILGYFGAVDERLDFELLERLCRLRPYWSVVLIGPLVGFSTPPVAAPNLHFMGSRPYDSLPAYLKGFDVCLMPFAETELTVLISPTKTPEYLAGGKPVVSTPIPDVEWDYGDLVFIARGASDFVKKVEEALQQRGRNWYSLAREKSPAKSWDEIVEAMDEAMRNHKAKTQ
jgi:glycosyltransferase involved in cell wall biosynthesis